MGDVNDQTVKEVDKSTNDLSNDLDELGSELDSEFEMTPQDIIREYHETENILKILMGHSIGLDHITNKYLVIIDLEKEEARKALGEENKDLFKNL